MAIIGTYIECPICKKSYMVKFERPKHFQPSFVTHQCKGKCEGKFRTKITCVPGIKDKLKQEHELTGVTAATISFMKEKGMLSQPHLDNQSLPEGNKQNDDNAAPDSTDQR